MAWNTKNLHFIAIAEGVPADILSTLANMAKKAIGKHLILSVREAKDKRSDRQNRYYWGVVIEAVLEMFKAHGNNVDAEEVHEYLKQYVGKLTSIVETPDGVRRTITRSSTIINTAEAEEYFQKIRAWAAEFDYQIPLPNEENTAWGMDL